MIMAGKMMGGETIPTDYILSYPFSGDLLDKSINVNNGIGSGTYSFVAGRKGTDTAISFNNGLIVTTNNVDLTSTDKISVSFWIKTSMTLLGIIGEYSTSVNIQPGFIFDINDASAGKIMLADKAIALNGRHNTAQSLNNNVWHHIVLTSDRSKDNINQISIIIDGVLVSTAFSSTYTSDNSGNYTIQSKMYFGDRYSIKPAKVAAYIGLMQDFKLYNRILTIDEITQLYNE